MRRLSAVHRRQYRVAAPLSLWHIDGRLGGALSYMDALMAIAEE